ncbi:MAG: hypothetical protein Fur0010_26900 [Bdellovibrio sp.]
MTDNPHMLRVIFFSIIFAVFFQSCRKTDGGSGGVGGVPTAAQVGDWLGTQTSPPNGCGDVQSDERHPPPRIYPQYKRDWKDSWSRLIMKSLDHPHLQAMTNNYFTINQQDLNDLDCPYFNEASKEEKKQFWVLFLASIAVPESHFKTETSYREANGTVSRGILQIDQTEYRRQCVRGGPHPTALHDIAPGADVDRMSMHVPEYNLVCGLYILRNQLLGGWRNDGRLYNPHTKNRLFLQGRTGSYWSVLQTHKQQIVKNHFKAHAVSQLPFCNKRPVPKSDLPQDMQDIMQRGTPGESQVYSKNCNEISNENRNSTDSDIERNEKEYFKNASDALTK